MGAVSAQAERYTSARLIPASQLSTSRTAPSIPTSPLAAMAQGHAATLVVQAEVEVACPAMAVPAIAEAAEVAAAPEETVGKALTQIHLSFVAEAAEVALSSMVETVHRRGAVEHSSAVVQAAATRIVAIMPLAPAAVAVEED